MRICPHNRQMEIPVCPYPKCHAGLRATEDGVLAAFPLGDGNRHVWRMQTYSPETGIRYWWVRANPDGSVPKADEEQVRRLAFGESSP